MRNSDRMGQPTGSLEFSSSSELKTETKLDTSLCPDSEKGPFALLVSRHAWWVVRYEGAGEE